MRSMKGRFVLTKRQYDSANFLGSLVMMTIMTAMACIPSSDHVCDDSKQLDFRIVGDIEGEWRDMESGDRILLFDEHGHLSGEWFGCEIQQEEPLYPLVPGESNLIADPYFYRDKRLFHVDLEPGSFRLVYKKSFDRHDDSTTEFRGEIVAPDSMDYDFPGAGRVHRLYRWRPGDGEATTTGGGTAGTSTTEHSIGDWGTSLSTTGRFMD